MKNIITKQLGRQLSNPKGLLGIIVGKFMNKHNKNMYADAYKLLSFSEGDRVLEVGFGNGVFISEITNSIESGNYIGIDISETMLKSANKKNKALIKKGKVKLEYAFIEQLPFSEKSFDKVFTLNTIYFWKNPQSIMQEIKRVLKPNGVFVVGLSTKESMRKGNYFKERFILYNKDEVVQLFKNAGFSQIETSYRAISPEDVFCIKGIICKPMK